MRQNTLLKRFKTPLLVIFSFLLGCMFVINTTPLDRTCKIDSTDREYNIMRNSKLRNPELIILILSTPGGLDRRNTIRDTWVKLADLSGNGTKFKMKHYFVLGHIGLTNDEMLYLNAEQNKYQDILALPIKDSYSNLTLKVLKSFEWLTEQFNYGLGFKYVLKCDDDSFVRIDKLLHEIEHIELIYLRSQLKQALQLAEETASPYLRTNVQINSNNLNDRHNNLQIYWGYFNGNAHVKKGGKWQEKNWIFCDKYVPYAVGGGYILSKSLVSYLGKNVEHLRQFNSEDISIGLYLSSVNNILRIHDIRFDTEWTSRGCQEFYLIRHKIPTEEMRLMYKNILNEGHFCSQPSLKRASYFYDWAVPPSQCCPKTKI